MLESLTLGGENFLHAILNGIIFYNCKKEVYNPIRVFFNKTENRDLLNKLLEQPNSAGTVLKDIISRPEKYTLTDEQISNFRDIFNYYPEYTSAVVKCSAIDNSETQNNTINNSTLDLTSSTTSSLIPSLTIFPSDRDIIKPLLKEKEKKQKNNNRCNIF